MSSDASHVPVMIGFALAVGGAVGGVLWALLRRVSRAIDAEWAAYAASRGLAFAPAGGGRSRRVTGAVRGVPVAIETLFERVGRGPARVVRVRVPVDAARAPCEFAVWPAGAAVVPREPPPGPSLFAGGPSTGPTVTLGDPAFDAAFTVVSAADAAHVARALGPAARAKLLALLAAAPVSLERRADAVVVAWFGPALEPARADAACELAVAVASAP